MARARELETSQVAPDELLFGLIRETKGIAAQVLLSLGLDEARALERYAGPYDLAPRRAPRASPVAQPERRFQVRIDDDSALSIYEQIVTQVREAVATGALAPGERLLPVRRLADDLDVAPGMVARAYAELESAGVLVTSGARGTRVADTPRRSSGRAERVETLTGFLRHVVVAAFHMGGTAAELRQALEAAMEGILDEGDGGTDAAESQDRR
jgi:GntR family transcriptional regulator